MFWPYHMMNIGWGGWLIGGLVMLLFWGGLIALVAFSIRAFARTNRDNVVQQTRGETALDILKRRYAQGEIDKSQYANMRRDLDA